MTVYLATRTPDPAAVAFGARVVFREDLVGSDVVGHALGEALADMDTESANDFMSVLGTIGQTFAAAAPSIGQGAAAGAVGGPFGAAIGAGLGLATHLAQTPMQPFARPAPRPRAPVLVAPIVPPAVAMPAPPPVAPPPPPVVAPPVGAPPPDGVAHSAPPATLAALASALQQPAVLQTLASLLASGAARPATEAGESATASDWLVVSGIARPLAGQA